jgi:hypothetical protein
MLNVQENKIIWAAEPKSYSGAAMAAKYVSMKNYKHLTILIQTGAWAGGTAAVTLSQATAVAGTGAKALAFDKQWNDVAASGTLVETAVTSDTFNLGTANKIYAIEIDADKLDMANGFDCVSLAVASPGANADFYGVTYILSGARYRQATPPSAIVD